jgi:hypothetical protein
MGSCRFRLSVVPSNPSALWAFGLQSGCSWESVRFDRGSSVGAIPARGEEVSLTLKNRRMDLIVGHIVECAWG